MSIDILVVGSGAREHALVWKLKQSPRVGKIYVAPGNGGTWNIAENVHIGVMEFEKLADFVTEKGIGITIPGPDDAFVGGIVDFFTARGLRIWGPTKDAANIEGSKAFAKTLMKEGNIPTAQFKVFTTPESALAHVRVHGAPIVIKASGLALGKGVYVCRKLEDAERAISEIMVERVHKNAGNEVVVEEFLQGTETSIHILSDGISHLTFPSSQDHKTALDGDEGKNTGGMGTIAPVPWITQKMMSDIETYVVIRTFDALSQRGGQFKGLLFPGIMMTLEGPKVLEFNARFGDPETQVYMRLLESDVLDLFEACIDGTLETAAAGVKWNTGFAANVVIASGGYPDSYQTGYPITGIEAAEKLPDVVVFHAGTKMENGQLVTAGGRVLSVSACGGTLKQALDRAYEAVGKIYFENMHFRHDIGAKSLVA